MNRQVFWRLLLAAMIPVIILSACGNQPTQAPTAQSTSLPQGPPTEEPTESPVETQEELAPEATTEEQEATEPVAPTAPEGGDLVYGLPSDIASFDPHNTRETVSGMVNSQIFDYLTVLNPDGSVGPGLAESWETSDDNLTWTFHLRQGITFHDGAPFNAEVVKINLDRILNTDNALPAIQLLRGVTEIRAPDITTLEVVTENPFGPLPYHFTHYSLGIISPLALENMTPEELAQNPVGSGPFKFVSYTPNESIVLESNPDYWGEGPFLSTVTFRPIPEAASRSVLLETGEADVVSQIVPQDVEALNNVDGVHVDVVPFTRVIFIHMNSQRPPLDNPQVRQALSLGVDRQAIVDNILRGFAGVANGPLGEGVAGFSRTEGYPYDPEMARQLLQEVGVENLTLNLWVPAGRYQGAEEASQAVQAQLAEIGVTLNLEVMEFASLLEQVRVGPDEAEWDMVLLGFAPATNDADWQLYSQFHSSSWAPTSNNRSYYNNPEVDALLEQGRFSTNPAERNEAYAEVLEIIRQDVPEIYLYQGTQIYGVNDRINGLVYLPIDIQDLESVTKSQ